MLDFTEFKNEFINGCRDELAGVARFSPYSKIELEEHSITKAQRGELTGLIFKEPGTVPASESRRLVLPSGNAGSISARSNKVARSFIEESSRALSKRASLVMPSESRRLLVMTARKSPDLISAMSAKPQPVSR